MQFDRIDLAASQTGKDFGRGFYLSADELQAKDLAFYKAFQLGGEPVVHRFSFDESYLNGKFLNYIHFETYSKEWMDIGVPWVKGPFWTLPSGCSSNVPGMYYLRVTP